MNILVTINGSVCIIVLFLFIFLTFHCFSNFSRPLETPEQNVRRLSCKPDIVLPHSDCFETNFEAITSCDQCGILYCSQECKHKAFVAFHRLLCHDSSNAQHPIVILLEAWKWVWICLIILKKRICTLNLLALPLPFQNIIQL